MPFKSDKQRKWMHANEPEMAKKWEKEESIKGKLRNLIKQEIKSINEGWWEDLSDKAQAAYIKKHGDAPNSSGKKEDDVGDHIRKGISKDKKGRAKMKKLNRDWDAKTSTASDIAKDMGGNMTGAVKKIEKIKKGLSDDPKVKAALRKANESVREDNIKFSKEEMAQLHKDGKVEKGGHTIEINESTKEYGKTLDKIAKDRQLKSISKKDRDTLIKISKLMKRANESINEKMGPEQFHKYMQYVFDTQFKTSEEKKMKKSIIKKINKAQKKKGLPLFKESINEAKARAGDYVKASNGEIGKINKIRRTIAWVKFASNRKSFLPTDIKDLKPTGKKEKGRTLWTESINEGFEKYHLGSVTDSKLKKRLERAIKLWGGKIDSVGQDYIKFRLSSFDVTKLPMLLKKLDHKKNVWIGDKRKKNIWDRRRNIDKLNKEATTTSAVPPYATPKAFSKSTQNAIDIDDEDDEKSESMAAPFRRRNSRGLGRVMKVGLNESDLGLTYKRGKTVKVTHKKSGKELVIIDKPNVKREYEKIGYFAEGKVNELSMAPFSSPEARSHINSDIKDMSRHLGKASQQVIKIMMSGVKSGKYTAMDISRGIQEGPTRRTHFGEMTFIESLWTKMREKFRKYSKDRKLS